MQDQSGHSGQDAGPKGAPDARSASASWGLTSREGRPEGGATAHYNTALQRTERGPRESPWDDGTCCFYQLTRHVFCFEALSGASFFILFRRQH